MIISLLSIAASLAAAETTTIKANNIEFNVKVGTAGRSSDCEGMTATLASFNTEGFAVVPVKNREGNYCTPIMRGTKPIDRAEINFEIRDFRNRLPRTLRLKSRSFMRSFSGPLEEALTDCRRYRDTIENLAPAAKLRDQNMYISLTSGCVVTSRDTVSLTTTASINWR